MAVLCQVRAQETLLEPFMPIPSSEMFLKALWRLESLFMTPGVCLQVGGDRALLVNTQSWLTLQMFAEIHMLQHADLRLVALVSWYHV